MTYKEKLRNITTFVFDFDGVLTDGTVWLMPGKEFVRSMNTRDSYAMHMAATNHYRIAVITGGNSEMVRERMEYLGIKDVFMKVTDKKTVLREFMEKNQLGKEEVLYMGDDLIDIAAMKLCGLSAAPADAAEEVLETVHYVSPKNGGEGCVRDVIEQTLKLQGKWKIPE
ncbi:MAG: KdsC family phosphatase [Bacteroidota bacterium]